MLGKVCLRRNDFLFFHSERCLKGEVILLQLDYLPVLIVVLASTIFETGHVSNYVEY